MAHNHPLLVWDLETSGICYSLIVNRWPVCWPFNQIINQSAQFITGRGHAESESGSISRCGRQKASLHVHWMAYYNSTKALEGAAPAVNGHWSIAEAIRYNQHGAISAVSH